MNTNMNTNTVISWLVNTNINTYSVQSWWANMNTNIIPKIWKNTNMKTNIFVFGPSPAGWLFCLHVHVYAGRCAPPYINICVCWCVCCCIDSSFKMDLRELLGQGLQVPGSDFNLNGYDFSQVSPVIKLLITIKGR